MKWTAFGTAQLGKTTPMGARLVAGDIGKVLEIGFFTRASGYEPEQAVYLSREQAQDLAEFLAWWLGESEASK